MCAAYVPLGVHQCLQRAHQDHPKSKIFTCLLVDTGLAAPCKDAPTPLSLPSQFSLQQLTSSLAQGSVPKNEADTPTDPSAFEYAPPAAVTEDTERCRLSGYTIVVKDIFTTARFPTAYGSRIFDTAQTASLPPRYDAAIVTLLQRLGATVIGKSTTTEFAFTYAPAPCDNPMHSDHIPGGSSCGSAAAAKLGMCDVAVGSQTGGSIIRPAAFCGVYGFKPTFGALPTSGMHQFAPSLDTVGLLSADLDALATCFAALVNVDPAVARGRTRPRSELCQSDGVHGCKSDFSAQSDLYDAAGLLGCDRARIVDQGTGSNVCLLQRAASCASPQARSGVPRHNMQERLRIGVFDPEGAFGSTYVSRLEPYMLDLYVRACEKLDVVLLPFPESLQRKLVDRIVQYEACRVFGPVAGNDDWSCALTPRLLDLVQVGQRISYADYCDACAAVESARSTFDRLFDVVDAILCPSVRGAAPNKADAAAGVFPTGDPFVNPVITALHVPACHMPLWTHDGLPVGLQLLGQRRCDMELLNHVRNVVTTLMDE